MIDEKLRRILTEFASKYPLDIDTVERLVKTKKGGKLLYGFFASNTFPEDIYRKVAKQVVESRKDSLLTNVLRFPTKYTLEAILSSSLDVKSRIIEIAYDICKCIFEVLNEWRQDLLGDEVVKKLRDHNVDFHAEDYEEIEWISKKTGISINDIESTFLSLDYIYELIWDDLTKCGLISTEQQMIDFFQKLSKEKELDDDHLKMINEVIKFLARIREHGLRVSSVSEDLDLNDLLKDD